MQQSGIFSNEKLHEYRYSVPVCYNHGGKKMSEKRKNSCNYAAGDGVAGML